MTDILSSLTKIKKITTSCGASNHFLKQRLTSLALIPLVIWFSISIAILPNSSHEALLNWFHSPFNSIMMLFIVVISFFHAQMGMQVIIDDYIPVHSRRIAAILIVKFASYFFMALGIYSILKLSLGTY